MNEKTLVAAVLSGDQASFGLLVKQYEKLVLQMVARVIDDPTEREELCQDVFVKVYEKLENFNFNSKLSTWIATIAYRIAINHLVKTKRKPAEVDLDTIDFEIGNQDFTFERSDFASFIHCIIGKMPEQYRIALSLFYLEGFSYSEIVQIMNIPEGTVKSHISRARQKLKTLLIPHLDTEFN